MRMDGDSPDKLHHHATAASPNAVWAADELPDGDVDESGPSPLDEAVAGAKAQLLSTFLRSCSTGSTQRGRGNAASMDSSQFRRWAVHHHILPGHVSRNELDILFAKIRHGSRRISFENFMEGAVSLAEQLGVEVQGLLNLDRPSKFVDEDGWVFEVAEPTSEAPPAFEGYEGYEGYGGGVGGGGGDGGWTIEEGEEGEEGEDEDEVQLQQPQRRQRPGPAGSAAAPGALAPGAGDGSGEIWTEMHTPEGNPYYFETRSRRTTWTSHAPVLSIGQTATNDATGRVTPAAANARGGEAGAGAGGGGGEGRRGRGRGERGGGRGGGGVVPIPKAILLKAAAEVSVAGGESVPPPPAWAQAKSKGGGAPPTALLAGGGGKGGGSGGGSGGGGGGAKKQVGFAGGGVQATKKKKDAAHADDPPPKPRRRLYSHVKHHMGKQAVRTQGGSDDDLTNSDEDEFGANSDEFDDIVEFATPTAPEEYRKRRTASGL